jgi:hypothetical protein
LANRGDLIEAHLEKTVVAMNTDFKDCNITGFESLIKGLELPDPDDKHVLALAIKSELDFIVTSNLKDFPPELQKVYSKTAIFPDDFIHFLYNKQELDVPIIDSLVKYRGRLKSPPMDVDKFISTISDQSLIE